MAFDHKRRPKGAGAKAAAVASRQSRHPVLDLQRCAGNAAVTALLQRDVPVTTTPRALNLNLPPDYVEKHDQEILGKITTYLNAEKPRIRGRIISGWSMPELVDLVRTQVPESVSIGPDRLAQIIRGWSTDPILEHRITGDPAGAESELIATIKNSFSKIPTSWGLQRRGMFFQVSLSGVEAGLGSAEGDKLSASNAFGQDVGVNLAVGKTHFAAKLEPGKTGESVHWQVNLSFPGKDPVPLIGPLSQLFGRAGISLGHALGDAVSGKATAGSLKEQWAPVKDAASELSTIADHNIVSLGLKVEGEGPAVSATATLTVTF